MNWVFPYQLKATARGDGQDTHRSTGGNNGPVEHAQLAEGEGTNREGAPASTPWVPPSIAALGMKWELEINAPEAKLRYLFDPEISPAFQAADAGSETLLEAGFYQAEHPIEHDNGWRVSTVVNLIGVADSVCLVDVPYWPGAFVPDLARCASGEPSEYQMLAYTLADALLQLELSANFSALAHAPTSPPTEGELDAASRATSAKRRAAASRNFTAASVNHDTSAVNSAQTIFTFEPWPTSDTQPAFALDSLAFSRQAYWYDPAISPHLQPWPSRGGICPNYRVETTNAQGMSPAGERARYRVVSDCPGIGPRTVPTSLPAVDGEERALPTAPAVKEEAAQNARHVLENDEDGARSHRQNECGEHALVAAEAGYAGVLVEAFALALKRAGKAPETALATGGELGEVLAGEPDDAQARALRNTVTCAWHVPSEDGFVRVLEVDPIWDAEGETARCLRAAVFVPGVGYVGTLRWSVAEDVEFAAVSDTRVDWLLRGAAVGTTAALEGEVAAVAPGGEGADPGWLAALVESVLNELRPQLPPAATRTQ